MPRGFLIEEHHKDLDQEKEVIIREANNQSMLVEDKVDDIAEIAKNTMNPYFKE